MRALWCELRLTSAARIFAREAGPKQKQQDRYEEGNRLSPIRRLLLLESARPIEPLKLAV
jgi:hypothetical protein